MRCSFCATGKGGFARNLAPHEIADQALTVQEAFGRRVSNVGEAFPGSGVRHGGVVVPARLLQVGPSTASPGVPACWRRWPAGLQQLQGASPRCADGWAERRHGWRLPHQGSLLNAAACPLNTDA